MIATQHSTEFAVVSRKSVVDFLVVHFPGLVVRNLTDRLMLARRWPNWIVIRMPVRTVKVVTVPVLLDFVRAMVAARLGTMDSRRLLALGAGVLEVLAARVSRIPFAMRPIHLARDFEPVEHRWTIVVRRIRLQFVMPALVVDLFGLLGSVGAVIRRVEVRLVLRLRYYLDRPAEMLATRFRYLRFLLEPVTAVPVHLAAVFRSMSHQNVYLCWKMSLEKVPMAEVIQRRGLAVEVTLQEVPVAVAALQEVPVFEEDRRVELAVAATLR